MGNYSEGFYHELALKWAPVNYQYINLSDHDCHYYTKRDLLMPVNMNCYRQKDNHPNQVKDVEACWKTSEIRKRLANTNPRELVPVAYYSVAETMNHFFVLYSFYHADDTMHPNDMEGCLVVLEKTADGKQDLLGMMTVAHFDFWKYSYNGRLLPSKNVSYNRVNAMEVDDDLESQHPLIQQESGKHGLYALGDKIFFGTKIWRWLLALINRYPDIIVYWPGKVALHYDIDSLSRYRSTPHYPALYYEIIDITDPENGLWHRRTDRGNSTFQEDGTFYGGKANPPWLWVENELENPRLNMWENPAELAIKWFEPVEGRKKFDVQYVRRMDGTVINDP